ncbi:unnamed protein product [Peniophora sp. CBMAI 1063]|nr:unnamed protein product [Peniophora sp. CBMAI 1063]
MGVLCACVPVGSYIVWVRTAPVPRAPFISMMWLVLVAVVTHWALSLRQLEATISGSALGTSLSVDELDSAIISVEISDNDTSYYEPRLSLIFNRYYTYGLSWEYLLPLLLETSLFGHAILRPSTVKARSCFHLIIPIMASVMYTLSLTHWAISCYYFAEQAKSASTAAPWEGPDDTYAVEVTLLTLLSLNAVMSDSIVLWRMGVVWERKRPILALGAALLITTLGLNIANIISKAGIQASRGIIYNDKDSEIIATYGETSIGLAAAFVSLASNFCATVLVGLKAWLHRRRFPMHSRSSSCRTIVERFMELLIDSGVVYTTIWLLYCISFFRPITSHSAIGPPGSSGPVVTAFSYLDAGMAQITSIYPLAVFILVALDKVHHSRGPQILRNNDWPKERIPIVSVTLEVDVGRNAGLDSGSVQALTYADGSRTEVDTSKLPGSETP